jgi:ABC-type Zn uptake system ZnuABC Zn-binding protein ZnuA
MLVLAVALGCLSGCGRASDPWAGEKASPKVVVTIAPLQSFVKGVLGKDRGAVRCLCTTTGPHHYQPDSRDARLLEKADVVFGIGLKLDDTFTEALSLLAHRDNLPFVKLGDKLPPKLLLEADHDEDDHKDGEMHDHKHDHGKYDPHVWLGIPQAIAMVNLIRDELSGIDEKHAEDYAKNARSYIESLKALQKSAPKVLNGKSLISFHESLNYFGPSFGLKIAGAIERGPGDEPTAAHLAALVEKCKKEKIRVIAIEPQYPATSSAARLRDELKAKGIDATLVTVDPLETADPKELEKDGSAWYEARMRRNLEALGKVFK